ncbi:MAG TPA: dicarboxylate transporter/tellurite-resistance protein TehA [Nevskia sp.]|nr:dicarboxylate transporter/tellurite-resistance protein TehA [Nevskia sp.]
MSAQQVAKRGPMPVAYFGIAVGLLALANAWRVGVHLWQLPQTVSAVLSAAALAVWLSLLIAYAGKWLAQREAALAEIRHPVQSAFAALGLVSSLLAAQLLLPWWRPAALLVFGIAVTGQLALALHLYGRFWQGGFAPEQVTPTIYLPMVAQNFVAGTAAAGFGWPQVGALFFGVGAFAWLAMESMILHRAAVHEPLPEALRPTLGIQLAPPVVGGVSYLAVSSGAPDLLAQAMLGYGLFQALLLLRLLPWIRRQPFAPSYWGFSFGVAALPTLAMRMAERGDTGPAAWLAPALFVAANLIIGALAWKTLGLLLQGKLLPPQAAAPASAAAVAEVAVKQN